MDDSAMLLRLNAETHAHHSHADAPWSALLAPDVRLQDYIHQLVVTYGFEAPVESALSYTKGLSTIVKLRERARSGLLAQDLLALDHSAAQVTELPQCFSIAEFDDLTDALGWLYVVERATLHHDSVRRNVMHRIPSARRATSYLAASESIAGTRWQALGRVLDKHAMTDAIADRIVIAADHAYRRLCDWIEKNQAELRSAG
jgi:heme oxygenase